jgi:RTA1 like protein
VYGNFDPSEYGTIAFINLFFAATFLTVHQIICHRKDARNPVFVSFLFLGTPVIELVGFYLRLPSVRDPSNPGLYLANMIIPVIGSLYLVAINWLTFPALIFHAGPKYSIMKLRSIVVRACIFLIACIHLQIRGETLRTQY